MEQKADDGEVGELPLFISTLMYQGSVKERGWSTRSWPMEQKADDGEVGQILIDSHKQIIYSLFKYSLSNISKN